MKPPAHHSRPELSFEQVKEAGLFAWNDNRYLFVDGRLLRMRPHSDGTVEVTDSDERARNLFTQRGWYHLTGCRCAFCTTESARRLEIVNVDDDDAGRYVLTRTLRAAGFTVVEADSGERALELVTPSTDLVLLDINMPGMDGFEVCRRLKSDPSRDHVPVVFVTATAVETESEIEGMEAGADAFVKQPIEPSQLLALVDELTRRTEPNGISS